ncbi:CHAT domain-containing protein [Pararhizobium sp. PWRC1-1]|uniref:CHAT domain-containing protein n=1 Tax=Pararhizobium sp. PWRC1-1 TaxID=2804566 RepID=UPI003CE93B34
MVAMLSPAGHYIIGVRAKELTAQTLAVSLRAASTLASSIRLPNGVNKTSELRDFTGYASGGGSSGGTNKAERVFRSVQESLARHTPAPLVEIISSSHTGVKLIADAPLEWLPIGDLPMSIALDVSRIPATPGNLMMMQLARTQTLYLPPKAFEEVLVVSSFAQTDPIRNDVRQAMDVFAGNSKQSLKFRQVSVSTSDEFVAAVNDFHGAMMIFDGHGSHDKNSGVGALHIGSEAVDIWELRGRMRPPPVVVLSACDTQSPDRTHATAGAGFLTCGATSVVGTFLPVRSKSAALFAARLALRAAWYTQAVVGGAKRPILWSEVVGGMLRLDFLSDLMGVLEKKNLVDADQAFATRTSVNMLVHTRDPDWWPQAKLKLRAAIGCDEETLKKLISRTVAEGDSIRYTHIGNPDLLCITDLDVMNAGR